MAASKLPPPNTADAYGANGFMNGTYQVKIVTKLNRIYKIIIDPNSATSKVEETDSDVTITIGLDAGAGGGATRVIVTGNINGHPASGTALFSSAPSPL